MENLIFYWEEFILNVTLNISQFSMYTPFVSFSLLTTTNEGRLLSGSQQPE